MGAGRRQRAATRSEGRDMEEWLRARGWQSMTHLAWRRWRVLTRKPGSLVRCLNYTVRINDGPNFYVLYKDIFFNRIYHFEAERPEPLILDCGSNIGMSILYFKHVYPKARIIALEPDPTIFPYLHENVFRNGLTDVRLLQVAAGGREGPVTLYSDGKFGSCLADHLPGDIAAGWTMHQVPCVRLRDYLSETVDFLKMNIEGAEYETLVDARDYLRQVREMVVEYHHLPKLPRTLHEILTLLHKQGFEYCVSDFNLETYDGARSPVRLDANTRYYRHIYARRID